MTPILSVVIPCYNAEKYLGECLDSLFKQSSYDWEAIIVDDGSTDNSAAVAKEISRKDSRFHYFYQNNAGASAARNAGVSHSSGSLILFLDADDWLDCKAIEEASAFMSRFTDYKMYNMRSVWYDEQTGEMKKGHCYNDYRHCLIYGQDNKVVLRKTDFEKANGFDVSMRNGFEDWEFYVRLLDADSKVKISEHVLYYYRINIGAQSVSSIGEKHKQDVMKYIFKKNYDKYVAVLGAPQLIYQWQNRRLPLMAITIQRIYQKVIDSIHLLMK